MSLDLSRDIELVGNELLSLFSSDEFIARLTAINSEKNDGVSLTSFVSKEYGWSEGNEETPAIRVLGLRDEPISDEGQHRSVWFKYAIEVYVSGDDATTLEKQLNRYARAINEIMILNYSEDGVWSGTDYAPTLKFKNALYKVCSLQYQIRVYQSLA